MGGTKNEFLGQHKRKNGTADWREGGVKEETNNNRYNLEVAQLKLAGYISWFIVFILFKYANSILQEGKVKSKTHSHIRQAQTSFMLRNWGRQLSEEFRTASYPR